MTRVVVFRALMLGDLLCATPALRALRQGLPGARLSLVGLPWARALAARLDMVDEFIPFPGWPGLTEVPAPDLRVLSVFLAQLQSRGFDLAVQLHGSGSVVNPLVAAFGARQLAGFADAQAWVPPGEEERFAPWPAQGTEVERLLGLTDHLGLPRRGQQLDFPLQPRDREAARALLAPLRGQPYAVVHAGAQLPSRRWGDERFAAVADALAAEGLAVVLTGTAVEAGLTARVAQAMHAPALDLAGRTDLWTLGAVVDDAALVLCNDTGLSHVAAALRTPSVVVSSGGDAARWAPADRARHRVLWQGLPCRPCANLQCPIGHPCATGVAVDAVRVAVRRQLQAWPPGRSRQDVVGPLSPPAHAPAVRPAVIAVARAGAGSGAAPGPGAAGLPVSSPPQPAPVAVAG